MIICAHCDEKFTSKNKLFEHLSSHGVERESIRSIRPGKIVLLVGWLSQIKEDDKNEWEMDGYLSHSWTEISDRIEDALFYAIDEVDGNVDKTSTSRGLSRASSCAQRASHLLQAEKTSHAVADVFCFQIPGKSKPKDTEWLDAVNSKLPSDIRVLEVYNLPSSFTDFHAEAACSQRVYEYVLPLNILFPPDSDNHEIQLEYRKTKEKIWCKMDSAFPRDTPQAIKRIDNFRRLKVLLKLFCGKNSYHNFVTGGASPEDGHVKRRVDRFYHKEMLSIISSKDGDIMISDVCHDPFQQEGEETSTPSSQDWAVLSMSGNTFLKGQPRRMIGLAIAVMWGWLPLSFIEAALSSDNIVYLPAVPGCGMYLSECRYDKWEAKSELRFDSRRIEGLSFLFCIFFVLKIL